MLVISYPQLQLVSVNVFTVSQLIVALVLPSYFGSKLKKTCVTPLPGPWCCLTLLPVVEREIMGSMQGRFTVETHSVNSLMEITSAGNL